MPDENLPPSELEPPALHDIIERAYGRVVWDDALEALERVASAVLFVEKPGRMAIVVDVKPAKLSHAVELVVSVQEREPKHPFATGEVTLYAADDGELLFDNPRQAKLGDAVLHAARDFRSGGGTVGVHVNTSTGEVMEGAGT